jgi:DNA-binding CsgD family transcriptional regulator
MARSLRVSPQYITEIKLAFERSGFHSQQSLAEEIEISLSTYKRFISGKSVDRLNFQEICRILALDWREITQPDTRDNLVVNQHTYNSSIEAADVDEVGDNHSRKILPGHNPQEFLAEIAGEHGVSEGELNTLSLALKGQPNAAIAETLGITDAAVRKRLGEVYRRFGITGSGPGKLVELKQILSSQYQQRSSSTAPRRDWGEAADLPNFYGRTEELATLEQWIVKERCRLVALLGMGGIGKTALAVQLARQLQDRFELVIWRSLRNAPPIQEILADLLKFLSNSQETDLPEDVDEKISQLIQYLNQHRCLLILDDVETILRSGSRVGRYGEGHESYGVLLKRVGEEQHQSCLLLSSQEKLREIVLLENPTGTVRSLQLEGLKSEDARLLLKEKGLTGEQKWNELIQDYKGNPLALKVVTTTIQDLFSGNVTEFVKHKTLVISDIFREVLDQQFNRLSELEKKIMQVLAREAKPISILKLREEMPTPLATSELIETLESLKWRSLIETAKSKDMDTSESLFELQPVIKKYIIKYHLTTY